MAWLSICRHGFHIMRRRSQRPVSETSGTITHNCSNIAFDLQLRLLLKGTTRSKIPTSMGCIPCMAYMHHQHMLQDSLPHNFVILTPNNNSTIGCDYAHTGNIFKVIRHIP
eukprot:GHUV01043380.1.p1 GENE.GHUV01043380.1~~GHUV01043380.1.p1  ORF type:complete len:111 (-),score=9.10 GHUV01043380.1:449-781(-)